MVVAPLRRPLERALPQAAAGDARLALGGGVAAAAVLRQFERVPAAHHGLAEVAPAGAADRDVAIVALADRRARHRAGADGVGQRVARLAAAGVEPAAAVAA